MEDFEFDVDEVIPNPFAEGYEAFMRGISKCSYE